MKLRTRSEMRLYQRARRARLRSNTIVTSNTGVTDSRRVIRTDHDTKWFPPVETIEERLIADIEEGGRKMNEAEEAQMKAEEKLEAHYKSLGMTDPEQAVTKRHLNWILAELRRQQREIRGYSKVNKAERERLQKLVDRTIEIKKQRYSRDRYGD